VRPSRAPSPAEPDPAALLECAGFGLLVLDAGSRVLYANAAGRAAVASGAVGLRFHGPYAAPSDPGDAVRWRIALAGCAVGRPSLIRLGPRPAAPHLSLAPDPTSPTPTPSTSTSTSTSTSRVLCTVPPTDAQCATSLRAYAREHRLTEGEAEVLGALARGASPKTIALARGSTEYTVRSQIRAILSKTGHRGLRELAIDARRSAPMPFGRP